MPRTRTLVAVATLALVVACTETGSFVEPAEDANPESLTPDALLSVLDASGPTGIEGFHFMPPVASRAPEVSEDLDVSLLGDLVIEICEWNGSECLEPLVAHITSQSEMAERLHLSEEAVYHTTWDTRGSGAEVGRFYRVRVLASGRELGRVDVEIIEPRDANRADDYEHVRLIRGQALPIGFVIEMGTLERIGPEGGTIELAEGMITLDVPAGAVSEDVLLTAVPATDVPTGGPPIVPGTAWNFGPDGIVFDVPITMTIGFDLLDVPSGVDPNELRIHKVVDGEFEQQDAGLVDLENQIVSARVDGFSVFVVIPRDPDNPEDLVPPVVQSIRVFDPSTGGLEDVLNLDTTTGDVDVSFHVSMTDNITGVDLFFVHWISPTGRQRRIICATTAPPDSGSDTNGTWECPVTFPQYAEAGLWEPLSVIVIDGVTNRMDYRPGPQGLCDFTGTQCISAVPQITVDSDPQDVTPPELQSLEVSLDVLPRSFGPSVSIDVASGPRSIRLGFQATDDLSGVSGEFSSQAFQWDFTGPSGQRQSQSTRVNCPLTAGTAQDGFFECRVDIPQQAETGTWEFTRLHVPDRTANGSEYTPDGTGQLCNASGNCVPTPTIEVVSIGDGEAPTILPPLGISVAGSDVITSATITDDLSGVRSVLVHYRSTATGQTQQCFASLDIGSPQAGLWSCTIIFSPFAARGEWTVSLSVSDVAGNNRFYSRRASDGFLCYFDQETSTQVCQDFGDTDIILQ